jgi:hypothetical protein
MGLGLIPSSKQYVSYLDVSEMVIYLIFGMRCAGCA